MVSFAKLYFSDFDVLVHSLANGHAGERGLSEGAAGTIASTGAYLMQSLCTLPHISLLLSGVRRGAGVGEVPAHQEASLNHLHRNPKAMHASPSPRGSCSPTPPATLHFPTSPATSLRLFFPFC
ncbi:hypothetical protein VitviT2T_010356 [Vitis vinifera]|uniref:Uncharacterized protein n=1 Tax=Vitis vinifera TaxID=29760 RepID=A0ABY9C8Y6_VITVI|nr:hypothetical protein VitviT2T_010356 [Vitis vinifera]